MDKFYGIHDKWTDLDITNDVAIKSTDGVIDGINVNGGPVPGFATKTINLYEDFSTVKTYIDNLTSRTAVNIYITIDPVPTNGVFAKVNDMEYTENATEISFGLIFYNNAECVRRMTLSKWYCTSESRPLLTIPIDWVITEVSIYAK